MFKKIPSSDDLYVVVVLLSGISIVPSTIIVTLKDAYIIKSTPFGIFFFASRYALAKTVSMSTALPLPTYAGLTSTLIIFVLNALSTILLSNRTLLLIEFCIFFIAAVFTTIVVFFLSLILLFQIMFLNPDILP